MEGKEVDCRSLAAKAVTDRKAMDALLKELDPMARKVASSYVRKVKGAENFWDDLYNAALEGVVNAVGNFNFAFEGFLPYVKKSMEMEARSFLSASLRTVRLPRYVIQNLKKYMEAEEYCSEKHLAVTDETMMHLMGIQSQKTYRTVRDASLLQYTYSLEYDYHPDESGKGTLEHQLPASADTSSSVEEKELEDDLLSRVGDLPGKERYVLLHSYGLFGHEKYANGRMAEELGVTAASVINYRNRALSSLRTDLALWIS